MHTKPTSPSMLGFRNQATVGNSTAMHTRNLHSPSRLPFTPIVPRITSGHADARENGYITPRSRGRSAIYSMARTPYSRIHPTNPSKVCLCSRKAVRFQFVVAVVLKLLLMIHRVMRMQLVFMVEQHLLNMDQGYAIQTSINFSACMLFIH